MKRPRIAIVGPGRLGTALALALYRRGYRITEIIGEQGRHYQRLASSLARKVRARARGIVDARFDCEIIWLCVPDSLIADVARVLAARDLGQARVAFHSSGALSASEIKPLRARHLVVAAVHPVMTFVTDSQPRLEAVPFSMEGDDSAIQVAQKIVRNLGGESFRIKAPRKAAYHAWATFASPLLIAFLAALEEAGRAAGIQPKTGKRRMMPIVQQTLRNYFALGPARSFSGPIVRGDVATVQRHLNALRNCPDARNVYISLSRMALGRLPVREQQRLADLLNTGCPSLRSYPPTDQNETRPAVRQDDRRSL
jgi:predicted short-subunit dehydrogenase-like oxidoreductase (DUF2520 family)